MQILPKHIPLRPVRPVNRPVPPDVESEPFGLRRVRTSHTYSPWVRCEYWDDAMEARSGLPGHPA